MVGLGELSSLAAFVRDRAYDTVFELGDTSLQFIGDMFRGYNENRYQAYAGRQIDRQEKKIAAKNLKQMAKPKERAAASPKPLKFDEKRTFAKMMGRQQGETIIEHWKRQKLLLAYPEKHQLIAQHTALQEKMQAEKMSQQTIEVERNSISSKYQKTRGLKQAQTRKRSRSR